MRNQDRPLPHFLSGVNILKLDKQSSPISLPIYLRLAGGLGNQLFQTAAATLVSSVLKRPIIVITSELSRYQVPREFNLLKVVQIASGFSFVDSSTPSIMSIGSSRLRLGRIIPFFSINDRNINRILQHKQLLPLYMDGYFQDFWTWNLFEQALAQMTVNPASLANSGIDDDEVLIHIRGGDFILNENLNIADLAFYQRAVAETHGLGFTRYALVTEDQEYTHFIMSTLARRFQSSSFRVIPSAGVLNDFNLIRIATKRIIGNSTFAWWATALGSRSSRTWSTQLLAHGRPKKFLLPGEITL